MVTGWSRFTGYLGLILVLGGSILSVLLPNRGGRGAPDPTRSMRDAATGVVLVGLALLWLRLIDVGATSDSRTIRFAARAGAVAIVGFGVVGFVGISLLLTSTAAGVATCC